MQIKDRSKFWVNKLIKNQNFTFNTRISNMGTNWFTQGSYLYVRISTNWLL